MAEKHPGSCHCGAVRFEGNGTAELHVCHCTDCVRYFGAPFIAAMFENGVNLTTPENVLWYASSDIAERGSCKNCGSGLFYRGNGRPVSSVAAGSFHHPERLPAISGHIYIDQKPHYYDFADDSQRMTRAEYIAKWGA